MKLDEKLTLSFLEEVAEDGKELTTKDITKYLRKKPYKLANYEDDLCKIIKNFEIATGKFDDKKKKEQGDFEGQKIFNYTTLIILLAIGIPLIAFTDIANIKIILLFICTVISLIVNGVLSSIIAKRINVLTQKGVDEKNKWKAFKKFMEDFSMLDQKDIPDVVLWEKYLVFATAFGISEKVLKQLKVVYPQIEDINSPIYTSFAYIPIMNAINIENCVSSAVYSGTYSSASGSGGGFSGGGGGGRWPEVAEEVAKK